MVKGSSPLVGMLMTDWVRVLGKVSGVPPRHWRRLAHVTFQCLLNEALHLEERAQFDALVGGQQPASPLFVLGLPRSGTTFLHQALCMDTRFATPNRMQAHSPHTFCILEGRGKGWRTEFFRRLNFLWSRIVYGNMKTRVEGGGTRVKPGFFVPAEDELAMAMNGCSSHLTYCFPNQRDQFERYRVGDDLTPQEQDDWQKRWLKFLKKLTFRYPRKQLVLKSHQHTARIPLLLRLFPDSRFLFISRHPDSILRSRLDQRRRVISYWGFQDWSPNPAEELEEGQRVLTAYLRDRSQIPAGHLHEIRYEAFCRNPVAVLEGAYQALSLPEFARCRVQVEEGLSNLGNFQASQYPALPPELAHQLGEDWKPYFETFQYEPRS